MNAGTMISGALLLGGNALFSLAEFGLLSVCQIRLQSLAESGNRRAKYVLDALKERHSYIAGIQIGITLSAMALAWVVEPSVTALIGGSIDFLPKKIIPILSIVAVTFPLVLVHELLPKFLTKVNPEKVGLALIIPLRAWVWAMKPIILLCSRLSKVIFNIAMIPDPPERNAQP